MKRDDTQAAATLSKPEAVWRAIEELGYQADVKDILDYVRTKFGIDDTPPAETIPPAGTEAAVSRPVPPPGAKPASQRKPRSRGDSNE